jgi:hypothetical protein
LGGAGIEMDPALSTISDWRQIKAMQMRRRAIDSRPRMISNWQCRSNQIPALLFLLLEMSSVP